MLTPDEETEWFDAELMPVQNVEDGVAEEVFGDVGGGNDFGQMRAEPFDAEIKYDAKIKLNRAKDAKYIKPSIEEGMAFEDGEGFISSKYTVMNEAEAFDAQRKLTDVDWEGKPYTGQIYPDDPDLDMGLADRNKDGKVSSWERALGNQVAKGTREWRQSKNAEFREYVKAGAGFGAGLALFQVSIISIALLAGLAKK